MTEKKRNLDRKQFKTGKRTRIVKKMVLNTKQERIMTENLYESSITRRWTAGKRKAESDPLVGPGFLTTLQTPGK